MSIYELSANAPVVCSEKLNKTTVINMLNIFGLFTQFIRMKHAAEREDLSRIHTSAENKDVAKHYYSDIITWFIGIINVHVCIYIYLLFILTGPMYVPYVPVPCNCTRISQNIHTATKIHGL